MRIDAIWLKQFRNYHDQEIKFHPQLNLILGKNGQGKSNLIEAVFMSLTGGTFRASERTDLIEHGLEHPAAKISSQINQNDMNMECEIRLIGKNKEIRLNNTKISAEGLKKKFSAVVFTPESLLVVKQGPGERRALMDSILTSVNKNSPQLLADYLRCLKTKNKILKDTLLEKVNRLEALKIMSGVETQFLNLATQVTFLRTQMLKEVIKRAKISLKSILDHEDVDITVDYLISQQSAIDWSQNQVYDALKSRLRDLHEAEWSTGQSLVGPHRHDIQINLNGKNLRYYGSQGQQRAVVLSFKLAQIIYYFEEHGEYPVLLLDDVLSELDSEKRVNLLKQIGSIPAQTFLTTTEVDEKEDFGNKDHAVFVVEKGRVYSGWK